MTSSEGLGGCSTMGIGPAEVFRNCIQCLITVRLNNHIQYISRSMASPNGFSQVVEKRWMTYLPGVTSSP